MHTALHQPLLEHRREIHERFDGDADHPLTEQPAQLVPPSGQGRGGQRQQGGHAQVAVLADVAPDLGQLRVGQRGPLGQQTQQRFPHRQLQLARQLGIGDTVGDQPQLLFEPVVADQGDQGTPLVVVVAQQVTHRAAVRVRTRQRGQVPPADQTVGLPGQPFEHAGVGEPVEGIDAPRASRGELRLNRHPAHERGVQRHLDDVTDLAVVDPQRRRHHQRGEDLAARKPVQGSLLDPPQVAAAVMVVGGQAVPVVLQVHLDPLPVRGEQVE
ncbi:hypothetical protein C1Y40_00323 [Mycobacterium talmoniae]|uniref:Uncharacterized protein n=1 Tax=Mycobacterium talmoniae TaxID=1858794 RepID=A0A2S8BS06_9MYCO|nr:hypothetical protein C1Y40_00323 [Mycobacterium talmoniae]